MMEYLCCVYVTCVSHRVPTSDKALLPLHVPTQWNSGMVQYFANKWTSDSVGFLKLMTLLKQQLWRLLSVYLGGHHVLSNACDPTQGSLCWFINQRLDSINTSDVFYMFWARLRHSTILNLRQHQSSHKDAALRPLLTLRSRKKK